MADACRRRARRYRTLFDVLSSLCHLHHAILIVPSPLRRRYMSWVGIAFGSRVRRCARYRCHVATI
jgi:hypothetical protein